MPILQPIPTQLQKNGQQYAEGFLTPKDFDSVQVASFAPQRVIPVIFIPGIMGTHLRMSHERQEELKKKNNVAWRPDSIGWAVGMILFKGPKERQLALDPDTTEVDSYDPGSNPTGSRKETSDDRHDNIKVTAKTPLLLDDPQTAKNPKSATQKGRERGWGEIFFDSYGTFLNTLEERLNLAFANGKLNPDWKDIIDVDPTTWQAEESCKLQPLTEQDLRRVMTNCFYPVHAFGYNWLQSNGVSGKKLAKRLENLQTDYRAKGFKCDKFILVTHSMGGLAARALCHPDIGNQQNNVLGIVHGVMPAIGAAAAYRRMRAGFESGGMIVSRVLGHTGPNVTAVLANAPGGLQLAPSEAYGNDWLQFVTESGTVLRKPLPEKSNPYEEIYPKADVWWGLLREQWINPAKILDAGLERTRRLVTKAQEFHQSINGAYYPNSYAHYGCDPKRPAFQKVIWEVPDDFPADKFDSMRIVKDDERGEIHLAMPDDTKKIADGDASSESNSEEVGDPDDLTASRKSQGRTYRARMLAPASPGDETVPVHSADDQLKSGKFQGVFRQTGYDHQDSYKDKHAIASTIYSIIRIAQNVGWWEAA